MRNTNIRALWSYSLTTSVSILLFPAEGDDMAARILSDLCALVAYRVQGKAFCSGCSNMDVAKTVCRLLHCFQAKTGPVVNSKCHIHVTVCVTKDYRNRRRFRKQFSSMFLFNETVQPNIEKTKKCPGRNERLRLHRRTLHYP